MNEHYHTALGIDSLGKMTLFRAGQLLRAGALHLVRGGDCRFTEESQLSECIRATEGEERGSINLLGFRELLCQQRFLPEASGERRVSILAGYDMVSCKEMVISRISPGQIE